MVDGPTVAVDMVDTVDHELTENNRSLVRSFLEAVLIGGQLDRLTDYVNEDDFAEHNPQLADDISTLRLGLKASDKGLRHIDYRRVHRVLAEGNFVLGVSEGNYDGAHCAFYDLFRVADGKLVEHWDTTETIAPRTEWKNNNGKF